MGLFKRKKNDEELAAMEANRELLKEFKVTKAWGVKNPQVAPQFVYDEDMKAFCIADGPVDDTDEWKEKNPWVIRFDEVEDVRLYVDEWWTDPGEKKEEKEGSGFSLGALLETTDVLNDRFHNPHVLTLDKYDEVYWKYDLFMRFKTTHPYAGKFEYKMNWKINVLMIPGIHLIARRGLELNGEYKGSEIREKREELEAYAESLKENLTTEKIVQILAKTRPDTLVGKMKHDLTSEWYVKRIENVVNHMKRAERITKVING